MRYQNILIRFFMVVLFIGLSSEVGAAEFANIPLGLTAEEIVKRQYDKVFSDGNIVDPGECVRGDAKPWFDEKNAGISSWNFRQANTIQSVEAIVMSTSGSLTIVNNGCESFSVSIRYEFSREPREFSEKGWWYARGMEALLLAKLHDATAVFDLDADSKLLEKLASKKTPPDEVMFVPVEGDGMDFLQTRLSVTAYGALPEGSGGFVELNLVKGPL